MHVESLLMSNHAEINTRMEVIGNTSPQLSTLVPLNHVRPLTQMLYFASFHVSDSLLLASRVRLNSMARSSLFTVSNPIPSILRRQNLS
jgi:hypothetical protein